MNNKETECRARPLGRVAKVMAAGTAVVAVLTMALAAQEFESSRLQALHFSDVARDLTFRVESGPSAAIRFPAEGPFDERMGYSRIRDYVRRLDDHGYAVDAQARFSPALLELTGRGFYAPYREKTRAGLDILDCRNEPIFASRHPERVYTSFEAIPPLVVQTLLFIENRHLLDGDHPQRNPAVDWSRLARAIVSQTVKLVDSDYDVPGGSTLATQIEKYRHSPEGMTGSIGEKFRQMVSASLRAYLDGKETLPVRHQIVLDYLNTVPLSAFPGYGEVNGLGDGLWTWYGADFETLNRALRKPATEALALAAQAAAYRQALSLMIAHRRPSFYLAGGRSQLAALTDSHLRLLADAGLIAPSLRDAALKVHIAFRDPAHAPAVPRAEVSKAAAAVRARLVPLLDEPLYRLDRLDLAVTSTLDREMQDTVTVLLHQLHDREQAKQAGLLEHRLLDQGDVSRLTYSFTLFERGRNANRVRVQTDNSSQPLDINEGTKLELGSTAKLRTLATYLEVIAALHVRLSGLSAEELERIEVHRRDRLTRWAVDHLRTAQDKSLAAMLEAAAERRYSASPHESFFTGGGVHTFENFKKEDDGRTPSVREALRDSSNLAFVRIMRDIVHHYMYRDAQLAARIFDGGDTPERSEYLSRFADREGRTFVHRFYRKYQGKSREEMLDALVGTIRPTPVRLAVIFRAVQPEAGVDAFRAFLAERLGERAPEEKRAAELYERYAPGRYSLPDQGYLANLHPLELWLVAHLRRDPEATLAEVVAASEQERQAVYVWLHKLRHKGAKDDRIVTVLEADAFGEIHKHWKRLGYAFDSLVPSYATALGSSGDRPAALAELMGIIVNDGMRLPTVRLEKLHFAAGTPYETVVGREPQEAERVMAPQIAAMLRAALADVVEAGTARRLAGAFADAEGKPIRVGGKTGTGDNRAETYGAGGRVLQSRAMNRTATFVFYVGERYFGTLTAFVPGSEAAAYRFTSALPVQILKTLAPKLRPFVDPTVPARCDTASKRPVLQRPGLVTLEQTSSAPAAN